MYKLTTNENETTAPEITQSLDELAREGARRMIQVALELEVEKHIQKMRDVADDYDLFVLSYHGGIEYAPRPSPRKAAFFRRLLDAGVDVIHGHHPHVLQPIERLGDKLVAYSLGNFVFDMWRRHSTGSPFC